MKKIIIVLLLFIAFVPQVKAQYYDWVTDSKSMAAFSENYLMYQLPKLMEYLALWKDIQQNQDSIARMATFIHKVRNEHFNSLQDVTDIYSGKDENSIKNVFAQVNIYYDKIKDCTQKYPNFKDTWDSYNKFVTEYSRDLLAMADMATKGNDERNLLDKNQRLELLSFVLSEMRMLKNMSKKTYNMLVVAAIGIEHDNSTSGK